MDQDALISTFTQISYLELVGACCSLLVQTFSNFSRSLGGSKHNCNNRLDLALSYGVSLLGFVIFTILWKVFRDYYHKKKISVSYFRRCDFTFIRRKAILKWNFGVLNIHFEFINHLPIQLKFIMICVCI